MTVVELFLPLFDAKHRRFGRAKFDHVRDELAGKFAGVTAFRRSPAEGLWRKGGRQQRDEIIVYEVLVTRVSRTWWKRYRARLEREFGQDQILIRTHSVAIL